MLYKAFAGPFEAFFQFLREEKIKTNMKRAKKSASAVCNKLSQLLSLKIFQIVLSSSALGSIGFPQLFHTLSSLRFKNTGGDKLPQTSTPEGVLPNRGLALSHRTKSMSILPDSINNLANSTPPHNTTTAASAQSVAERRTSHQNNGTFKSIVNVDNIRKPKGNMVKPSESLPAKPLQVSGLFNEDEDWNAEFGFSEGKEIQAVLQQPQTVNRISKPRFPQQSIKAMSQRRIQSAPSVAQRRSNDDWTGSDIEDALLEHSEMEEDFFLADSVKQKLIKQSQKDRELSISVEGLESWDEDFETSTLIGTENQNQDNHHWSDRGKSNVLVIPNSVAQIQGSLKTDALNVRKFSLHIEGTIQRILIK
jgi:hypothetical protein